MAVWLVPSHQDADLDRVSLPIAFGFASQNMTHGRVDVEGPERPTRPYPGTAQ
jgi:hypothetical protein